MQKSLDSLSGNRKAVCLFSGGLDSTTTLYVALSEGYLPLAVTFDYGQLHRREIEAARMIAESLNIKHQIVKISLPWGGSSLIDAALDIPENRSVLEMSEGIPSTYVPARNTIFLSFAMSLAEAQNCEAIFIGANALDYSGYPDCRPDYFELMEAVIRKGTKRGVEGKPLTIKAPLLHLKKSEIVKLGAALGVPFERTWSCYRGGEVPCSTCDACLLREKGFEEAGMHDPIRLTL